MSIGTLLAFAIVCGGVLVLRYTDPNIPRPVPHAVGAVRAAPGRALLRLPHGGAAEGHLGPAHRLDGARPGHLLLLRAEALAAEQVGSADRTRRRGQRRGARPCAPALPLSSVWEVIFPLP